MNLVGAQDTVLKLGRFGLLELEYCSRTSFMTSVHTHSVTTFLEVQGFLDVRRRNAFFKTSIRMSWLFGNVPVKLPRFEKNDVLLFRPNKNGSALGDISMKASLTSSISCVNSESCWSTVTTDGINAIILLRSISSVPIILNF